MSEFSWSHTHSATFDTCPRQYEAKYVTKEVKFQETDATRWGNHVHKVAEDYLRDGFPVPLDVPYQKQFDWVKDRAERFNAKLVVEGEYGLTSAWEPCEYFDRVKKVWCRSKLDVLLLRPDGVAEVIDWKTGKPRTDKSQLMLYALFVLAHYPEIEEVRTGYAWLGHNQMTPPTAYLRFNAAAYRSYWDRKYLEMHAARERGVFVPKPSGLCRQWCDVVACDFHGKGQQRR